ncbi:carbohydrate kinase family protein [Simiduia agarivorans]|uniref:Ribokinase family sugar kinase n=1 Tax=Simiduia agarivorans (strain DSM 21679 / JCM 13881 / BCRC 17597 / SA1) TaxID=1117647 RepID=K4KQ84_SIMAS|nr:carbohydrate kinase [Simiduia agarivorans]AFV00436.1 ribokinase family sugar kinase [Simiduia agarivorans SA1 = DSM 21679]
MNSSVVCFGEALIDFLNVNARDQQGLSIRQFEQFPGGAPANVAVALAKLKVPVRFLGQVGQDLFGEFLIQSLSHYGVDTRDTYRHPTAPTALAFVFLDEHGDRSFSFYRNDSADLLITEAQCSPARLANCNLFHFCSNTLTQPAITQTTRAAVAAARAQGAVVSFDVNLRHNLWPEGRADSARVNELVLQSDIVKFSRDEWDYLAQGVDMRGKCFDAGVQLMLITDGGSPVQILTAESEFSLPIPAVNVVDTTAGGDGFSGGLLAAVHCTGLETLLNDQEQLRRAVSFAIDCGAVSVSRKGAFPALPTAQDVDVYWR